MKNAIVTLLLCFLAHGCTPSARPPVNHSDRLERRPALSSAARAAKLRGNIKHFVLCMQYYGPAVAPRQNYLLLLSVPPLNPPPDPAHPYDLRVRLSEQQAQKIVEYLETAGWLEHMNDTLPIDLPTHQTYILEMSAAPSGEIQLWEHMGWGLQLLKRLEGLRAVLDGESAKALDTVREKLAAKEKPGPVGFVWICKNGPIGSAKLPMKLLPENEQEVLQLVMPADTEKELYFRYEFGQSANDPLRFVTDSFTFKDGVAELKYHRLNPDPGPPKTPIYYSRDFSLGRPTPGKYVIRVVEDGQLVLQRKWEVAGEKKEKAEQTQFKIDVSKKEDAVTVIEQEGKTILSVTSPSGIGRATIKRTGEKWPEKLILRLHLASLESLGISAGKMRWEGGYLNVPGHPMHLTLWKENDTQPYSKVSPYWMEVREFDAQGKAIDGLPGNKVGYFQMLIPRALLSEKEIKVGWIDAYR